MPSARCYSGCSTLGLSNTQYLSNLARTSATMTRLSRARSVKELCSNSEKRFLLSSMARPLINFSTTCRHTGNNQLQYSILQLHGTSGLIFAGLCICPVPLQPWCANWWRSCTSLLHDSRRWCSSPVSPAGRRSPPVREQTPEPWSSSGILQWKWRSARCPFPESARVPWYQIALHTSFTFYSEHLKKNIHHPPTDLLRWKRRYLRMARLGRKVQLMHVRRCQWARLAGLFGWGTWLVCLITWQYTWKRKNTFYLTCGRKCFFFSFGSNSLCTSSLRGRKSWQVCRMPWMMGTVSAKVSISCRELNTRTASSCRLA